MKEDIENTSNSSKETRNVFIGAKVTPTQKEYIKSMATQCGMTISDYLLSCAYNFKPKARLTKEEAVLLQNLDDCRADLVKYTSALHGMSTKQRMAMFNQIPFMVNWLKELGNVAESVCQFLNAVKEKNKIPTNLKSEEKRRDKKMVERVNDLDETIKSMKEEYGRKVSVDEVAERMGITEDTVEDILKLAGEEVKDE